jgi:tetratricopeptide (TPR) repeat protein
MKGGVLSSQHIISAAAAFSRALPALFLLVLARPALKAESIEEQIAQHFRAGVEASRSGQLDRAVQEYKTVLRLDPTLSEAHANLGLAYHSLGDYKLAIAEFETALSRKPEIASARFFLGIDYLKLGYPAQAVPHLQAIRRTQPSNREAVRALATCYRDLEEYGNAAEQLRIISSLERGKAGALYDEAHGYLDLAKSVAGSMSQRYRDTAWANRLGGDLLADSLRWTDAAVLYRKALQIAPNDAAIHASLGQTYLNQGDLALAGQEFQNALRLDPCDETSLLGMAELQLSSGAADAALGYIQKAWSVSPAFLHRIERFPVVKLSPESAQRLAAGLEKLADSPARHFLLGALYSISGAEEKAQIQSAALARDLGTSRRTEEHSDATAANGCESHRYLACVKALEKQEHRSAASDLRLGEALFALGDDARSAGAFEHAIAEGSEGAAARYWLARTYKRLAGDTFTELLQQFPDSALSYQFRAESDQLREAYDEAARNYQTAIRLRPDDPELHEKLSQVYLEKKMFAQADQELTRAIELDPGRARSLYLLGRSRLSQHQDRESVPFLQKALRLDPTLLEAHIALGQAYMRLKQPASALPELQKAAAIDLHGDVHYLLYLAYRDLGKNETAQKALARSQELRNSLAAKQRAMLVDAIENKRTSEVVDSQ